MKKFFTYFFLSMMLVFSNVNAQDALENLPQVNILTWWGYLDRPWIIPYIQEKCHASLSFDEYYTNDEFQRRWENQKSNYDIIIFEDIFYRQMKHEIFAKGSDVSDIARGYNKAVREHYYKQDYEKNVLYFFQSITGFLWNNRLVQFKDFINIDKIFSAAGSYKIIILDDPQVVRALIDRDNDVQDFKKKFEALIKNKNVHIGNDYSKDLESSGFLFSYTWSGDAIFDLMKSNKPYLFIINPAFSYISSDLIAQVSNTAESKCVMRTLSSKDFLNKLQKDVFYFSPYTDIEGVSEGIYYDVYKMYLQELHQLKWIGTISNQEYSKVDEEWKTIKLTQKN